ncbi:hypothetical protein BT93_L4666 [Corymbia citriodora subsp. variegata]|uniref:Uncharacterized protein n=1 Tax=Corymbia citriodora subsp. variegata TaxID=360336 RepID=A0A8T0CJL2_CORYI|nr:hypothetical protein BT93_L4666 [Corymbia citriodora subsp. variegata]
MEYVTFEARVRSYAPPTKRSKLGWPHKKPTPEALAKAGFFYKAPTAGNSKAKDNVQCFHCERQLDGWEAGDDPIQEHLQHGSDCAWAVLMALDAETDFDTSNMEDPTDTRLSDARRSTFDRIDWPHQNKRGWLCKVEKMVEAGWYFAPNAECEDYVSCVYCKLSLDGWEPKDNPFEEHHKRSPSCPFFVFAGTTAPSKRPKAKKGRVSRTSKASSRVSTQSNVSVLSQIDSVTVSTLDEEATRTSLESTISTTKPKRKAPARKATKTKRSKTSKADILESDLEAELETEPLPSQEVEVHQILVPTPKTQTGSTQAQPEDHEAEEAESDEDYEDDSEGVAEGGGSNWQVEGQSDDEDSYREASVHEQMTVVAEPTTYPALPPSIQSQPVQDTYARRSTTASNVYATPLSEAGNPFTEELGEPDNEATPQAQAELTGPPPRQSSPIPAKQISPIRPQANATARISQASVAKSQPRNSSRKSAGRSKSDSPSEPSDIENAPPSSRPERTRPPLSSPGKPQPRWTAIDVDHLLQSVSTMRLFQQKEEVTETERRMTVHEWINYAADQAAENLKMEGERIVGIFEEQGQKAMNIIESIPCI